MKVLIAAEWFSRSPSPKTLDANVQDPGRECPRARGVLLGPGDMIAKARDLAAYPRCASKRSVRETPTRTVVPGAIVTGSLGGMS